MLKPQPHNQDQAMQINTTPFQMARRDIYGLPPGLEDRGEEK
jgi:hypothetical protein